VRQARNEYKQGFQKSKPCQLSDPDSHFGEVYYQEEPDSEIIKPRNKPKPVMI